MASDTIPKYLIHIRLGECDIARMNESVPLINKTIKSISNGNMQLAYTSEDGKSFSIIAECNKSARYIRAVVSGKESISERFGDVSYGDTGFRSDDSIFVIEVGSDFSAIGFGKLSAWMQYH